MGIKIPPPRLCHAGWPGGWLSVWDLAPAAWVLQEMTGQGTQDLREAGAPAAWGVLHPSLNS